ncbi:MAG: transketolase family protein [Clostridiales Family XIII bacterium]|jgi:transketolase|nr:transketolase family protein [Clostridiales Family XIII bacterium]
MADKMATRQAYGDFLVEKGKTKKNLIVMDADLSKSTMTAGFAKAYPDRFFNMGIAEQNLYGVAAGLALSGKVVCASTFAMFASGRAFEIIRNSIGYTRANVKVCATHAGISVGEDGASHQTFEDIALMRTVPGMTVLNPSDANSAKKLLEQAVETDGPFYVRLGRLAVPVLYADDADIRVGRGQCLRDGKDYTVIATGLMTGEALAAAETLAAEGVDVRVIDMHTIKPLDGEIIEKAAAETKGLVTAEEHSVIGGLGGAVAAYTAAHCPVRIAFVGQKDTYGESGKPPELLQKYGMTAADIASAVRSLAG